VAAAYTCSAAGICAVANGADFDTSTPGTKTFTVTATDDDSNNTVTQSVTYVVLHGGETVNGQFPFGPDMTADPCNPSVQITFSGNIHVHGTLTYDAAGGVHSDLTTNLDQISATGSNGLSYRFMQNGQVINFPNETFFHVNSDGSLEVSQNLTIRFVSQGPRDNFHLTSNFHLTITPNGDVKGVVSNFSAVCTG
jgi:hypothetical protein